MQRIPESCLRHPSPYFEFCRQIVDATAPHCAAFKPQFAHFAAVSKEQELAQLLSYIAINYPNHVSILDAKRGDIGSTANFYAIEAFERYQADAVTINPYLGYDSISPYLKFSDKGVFVLCRTSNPNSDWIQKNPDHQDPVFELVAKSCREWDKNGQIGLVTGATYPQELSTIRQEVGHMPLLVPGIGAQGGDLPAVLTAGVDERQLGLLISSSRNIIYAAEQSDGKDFAQAAGVAAESLCSEINEFRDLN